MKKLHEKWPVLNGYALMVASWVFIAVFTFVLEWVLLVKTGWLAWSGAIPAVTLWAGTKEQNWRGRCVSGAPRQLRNLERKEHE